MDILGYLREFPSNQQRRHVLALTEHIAQGRYAGEGGPSIVFDGADVASFIPPIDRYLQSNDFGWHSFKLKTALIAGDYKQVKRAFTHAAFDGDSYRWWLITLTPRDGIGPEVDVYDDILDADSTPLRIQNIREVPNELQGVLDRLAWAEGIEDASASDIRRKLSLLKPIGEPLVAVYDVGQASCSAVLDDRSIPLMYFDFGRPLGFNKKTELHPWPKFCYSLCPPVVLSHWDFDHWAGARVYKSERSNPSQGPWREEVMSGDWIAPRQYLSPNNLALAQALHQRKRLFFWPSDLRSISLPFGRVVQCTGPNWLRKAERNDSGLALFVTSKAREAILLPGDADFPFVPLLQRYRLLGLVASHHGAKVTSVPTASQVGRVAFSVGEDNCYHHPRKGIPELYAKNGWHEQLETRNRKPSSSGGCEPGSICLALRPGVPNIRPPCRGVLCSLYISN